MFRRLLSVGGFTLLSRITGFVRDVLMAWILGKGVLSDAFIVAFLFPNYFRAIFGEGTINPAFLPRYAALRARGELGAAELFADHVFSWQMACSLRFRARTLLYATTTCSRRVADNPDSLRHREPRPHHVSLSHPDAVAVQPAMLNAIEKFWAAAAWSNLFNLSMIATLVASELV
jgi:putative peptidoglycan lipid II flippase